MRNMKTKFNKITIIGVGLIGGSIGLAVKRKRLAGKVTGVTAHRGSLQKAVRRGAIDAGTLDVVKSVRDADLVIVCTPVDAVVKTIKKIRKHLKPGAIVTDAASTKAEIVSKAEKALKGSGAFFVGAHPIAGSEKRGVEEARAVLF